MHGKKIIGIACGVAASLFAAQAQAMMSIPMGWYLEANIGSTHLSDTNYPGKTSSSGLGGNVDLGYKFMPFFAAEIGYTRYANSDIKDNLGRKAGWVRYYSYDLAAKGILPIVDSGVELFAKLGVGRINAKVSITNSSVADPIGLTATSSSKTGLYAAVGGQYYFMPEFAVNVQWARAKGNSTTGSADLFSIGASFLFE